MDDRELPPEYVNAPELPDIIEICSRCKRGLLVYLGQGSGHPYVRSLDRVNPWCYVCGDRGYDGIKYERTSNDSSSSVVSKPVDAPSDSAGLEEDSKIPQERMAEVSAFTRDMERWTRDWGEKWARDWQSWLSRQDKLLSNRY